MNYLNMSIELFINIQRMMHVQYPAFSYHDWTQQYSSDGGQVYSLCLTNFELGTTTFDGKSILTWDVGKESQFNDMEVPDLCSVFDYKFVESEGSSISIQDQEERYQHLQQLYNEYTGTDTLTASSSKSSKSIISDPTFVELNVSDSTIYDNYYYAQNENLDDWRSGDDRILDNGVEETQMPPEVEGASAAAAAPPPNRELNGIEYPIYPHIPYRSFTEDGEFQQDVIYRDTDIDVAQLGGHRVDEYDQSGWLVPPKGAINLPPALRRRDSTVQELDSDLEFPRTDTNLFGDPEDIDPEFADNGEIPRTFQTVFDDYPSPDRRMERTKAMTEEEWSGVLQKHREGVDQDRRAVGPQEWREIVDSYHGHDTNPEQYPGRRLLVTDTA